MGWVGNDPVETKISRNLLKFGNKKRPDYGV